MRSHIRNTYPGACAIEFLSQLEILISKLICWDDKEAIGHPGIFGEAEAYGVAIEEQGRKTLHGHILVWIKDFNTLRSLLFQLFHEDSKIQNEAKEKMFKYIKNLNSSYGGLHISVKNKRNKETDDIQDNNNMTGVHVAHAKKADSLLSVVTKQKLRNMRHKDLCIIEKGTIAIDDSKDEYSTVKIVNNSLKHWYKMSKEKSTLCTNDFPMMKERQDIYCMRSIYDFDPKDCKKIFYNEYVVHDEDDSFDQSVACRKRILNLRFNEHDFYHRPSCFKKGCECRANLPMMMWPDTSIEFDKKNEIPWHFVDGTMSKWCPFQVITKRLQGDQFLNVHNPVSSYVFSCNTNIQIGQLDHVFYNTLYGSKAN